MGWLDRWWKSEPEPEEELEDHHSGGPLPTENGDWVVLPYRIAEACRISLMTVGSHPDLPGPLKVWIAQWLENYNAALSGYFQENYGDAIFPVLNAITYNVTRLSEEYYTEQSDKVLQEAFDNWEREFKAGEHGPESEPPHSPPAS